MQYAWMMIYHATIVAERWSVVPMSFYVCVCLGMVVVGEPSYKESPPFSWVVFVFGDGRLVDIVSNHNFF